MVGWEGVSVMFWIVLGGEGEGMNERLDKRKECTRLNMGPFFLRTLPPPSPSPSPLPSSQHSLGASLVLHVIGRATTGSGVGGVGRGAGRGLKTFYHIVLVHFIQIMVGRRWLWCV